MSLAQRRDITLDADRTLPVYSWGDGPSVLLVHGWSSRASQLAVYAAPLVDRGFRVIAFDQPGHGEAGGKRASLPEFAAAVQRVADRFGPLYAVFAHSLGSAGTTVALADGLAVKRVVYVAPPEDPGSYLRRLARLLGFSSRVAALAQARIEREVGVTFEDLRGSTLAPNIDVPLLVIHDEGDVTVPHADGRLLTETWKGSAQLITTQGLGHNRIVANHNVVSAAVGFLAQPPPANDEQPAPRAVAVPPVSIPAAPPPRASTRQPTNLHP